jgi:hypothetical protein
MEVCNDVSLITQWPLRHMHSSNTIGDVKVTDVESPESPA